jgi:hypothetical protein
LPLKDKVLGLIPSIAKKKVDFKVASLVRWGQGNRTENIDD